MKNIHGKVTSYVQLKVNPIASPDFMHKGIVISKLPYYRKVRRGLLDAVERNIDLVFKTDITK